MTESIREQIEFLKISGSVLPPGSAEKIADTMERLLAVYEAVQTYKVDFSSMSMEAEVNSRTKVFEALDAAQTRRDT